MDEEYEQRQQSCVSTEVLPKSLSQSSASLQQSVALLDAPALQQPSPPLLTQPSEATVTFPSSSNTTASFSSNYISHGVDLTALTTSDLSSGSFGHSVPHKCVKCTSSFATPYELAIHWQEEHRDNYKCKRCDRCFAKKHNLQRHNCVNACNVCGQQFTRRYNLKLHMQVHGDGSKMYKCEYCGKSFTRRYTLLTHTRSHSGIKLFKCNICGKAFTRQHTLNLHLKRHVTKASFFCRKCYAVFTDSVSLQLHRETEHPKVNKEQAVKQASATMQAIPPASNVVFPNASSGYMYSTENVGQPPSYQVGPYYHQGSHDQASQLQRSYQENGSSSNVNPEQEGFDNGRETNLMPETSGSAVPLNKPNWFEDEDPSRGSFSKQPNNLSQEQESDLQASNGANIVTVVDSDEEVMQEERLQPDESADVTQETMDHEGRVIQTKEAMEGNTMGSQEPEPEEELRRSLFPLDNSRREKRLMRHTRRPTRGGWKHGNKLVKETSEIRIDIVNPSTLEEINPLLTPPRSSETSTPRLNQASSESGSPGGAPFPDISPSYSSQHHQSKMKTSGSPDDKSGQPSRLPSYIPSHEDTEPPSLPKVTPHGRGGDRLRMPSRAGAAGNSDSSSSEVVSQRSLLQVPRHAGKHGKEAPQDSAKWRCVHCGITFEESLMYVVHMGCHGQLDPFQCSMCGLACQDRMAFTLHIIGGKHIRPKP